jgi:hypothetical protein
MNLKPLRYQVWMNKTSKNIQRRIADIAYKQVRQNVYDLCRTPPELRLITWDAIK